MQNQTQVLQPSNRNQGGLLEVQDPPEFLQNVNCVSQIVQQRKVRFRPKEETVQVGHQGQSEKVSQLSAFLEVWSTDQWRKTAAKTMFTEQGVRIQRCIKQVLEALSHLIC